MCEGLRLDRRGMWKVEEDSFTKRGMVLLGWGGGAVTVKSDGVRELGSSSLANLPLLDEVMKTNYRFIHFLPSVSTRYCWGTFNKHSGAK